MSLDAHVDHVRELLASVPDLRFRRMFGGVGVYSGARMFGLMVEAQLYLKTDALSRGRFEAAGSAPFAYARRDGRVITTSYWRLPAAAEDDPLEAEVWTRSALESAGRKGAARRASAGCRPDLGPGPWDE